jgi:hypothetical protein
VLRERSTIYMQTGCTHLERAGFQFRKVSPRIDRRSRSAWSEAYQSGMCSCSNLDSWIISKKPTSKDSSFDERRIPRLYSKPNDHRCKPHSLHQISSSLPQGHSGLTLLMACKRNMHECLTDVSMLSSHRPTSVVQVFLGLAQTYTRSTASLLLWLPCLI